MDKCPTKSQGLTLVELIGIVIVAVILASLAFPDVVGYVNSHRSASDISDVLDSLTLARHEAVRRNSSVAVCKSANGTACQDNGTTWNDGWLVFEDRDLDGTVNEVSEVISVHHGLPPGRSLTFSSARVVYASTGMATSGGHSTFVLCDSRGAIAARGLILSASGRPRAAVDSNANGVVENIEGDDVTCDSIPTPRG